MPPIFFLFTYPDLVVSQSGFSIEITHFFKESSHTVTKVSPKTNKQTNKQTDPVRVQQTSGTQGGADAGVKSEGWLQAQFLVFVGKSVLVQAFS